MPPTLAEEETWIYFLAEAPGFDEAENTGKPLTGPSGKLLRRCITIPIEHCSFDNCVRDRPSKENDDPPWSAIACCRGLVTKSIEEAKPKLIVGLGKFAQQWMLNNSDTTGMRGRLFVVQIGSHICYFLPTYHPARVIHSAADQAKRQRRLTKNLSQDEMLRSHLGRTFKFDIEKACKIVKKLETPIIPTEDDIRSQVTTFDGNKKGDFEELMRLFKFAKIAPIKAIDIETTHLRPYYKGAKILSCALSFKKLNISFALDHPKAGWSVQQLSQIKSTLKDVITDDTVKIAHHAPFEIEWFCYFFGKESINHVAWECTQLQSHFLDERRGAGQSNDAESKRATYLALNFLVKMHFGVPFKEWFSVDRKHMGQADLSETLVYNAADTLFTLMLWGTQTQQLRTMGLYSAYWGALPRQVLCPIMQYLGMPVNQAKVKEFQSKLSDQVAVIETEIESLPVVQQYIKDKSKIDKSFKFNPMGHDALNIFRDYLKCKEVVIEDDGKKPRYSIDKHILEKIDHPLSDLIVRLRNRNKMKSTYVDGLELGKGDVIFPDGKIHCNFNTTFTTTGRLSSDDLNMQNFPQRNDSWVREEIEAQEGYVIVACDYSQLEMCAAGMCTKDKVLVKYLWEDYDSHYFWASRLAELCPERVGGDFNDPKIAKKLRSEVKNLLVFPAIYGSSNGSMAEGLGVDIKIINELMSEYWGTFTGIKQWQNNLLEFYRINGYVESPTGRRRRHPLTTNEAINFPLQCLASDLVVDAMNRLSYIAATEGKWYLHPHLNIHDDATMLIPKKHLDTSLEIIIRTLLTFDFDFINVPLAISVSMGPDWYHMSEFSKFSTKDL